MHLKHRPNSYDEIIGNSIIKRFIMSENLGQPLVFEGETGIGKTTFAYIVANDFGAPKENIVDLNCVHFSKVEEMRDRIEKLYTSSLFGSKRVLILDEIHELSQKTQEVLLKPLETLPEDILILACTTTTDKVIQPLLDRFIRLRLKPLTEEESKLLIGKVCTKENIKLPKLFKMILIDKSDGIPRRLLTGLSKIKIAENEEEVRYLLELESIDNLDVLELMKLITNSKIDWKHIRDKLREILKSYSPENIKASFINILSGRVMSDYFSSDVEGEKLIKTHSCLMDSGYLPKADLIMSVYKIHRIYKGS